jgi:hypothetical protein
VNWPRSWPDGATAGAGPRDKIAAMDNEHINAIGALLADLSERTQQLRGYL